MPGKFIGNEKYNLYKINSVMNCKSLLVFNVQYLLSYKNDIVQLKGLINKVLISPG